MCHHFHLHLLLLGGIYFHRIISCRKTLVKALTANYQALVALHILESNSQDLVFVYEYSIFLAEFRFFCHVFQDLVHNGLTSE